MPAGAVVTVPAPVPVLVTARVKVCSVKVAVQDLEASIVTTQRPVPVQAPVQPVKVAPVAGAAISATIVAGLYVPTQSSPQSIPGGTDKTLPEPPPFLATDRVKPVAMTVFNDEKVWSGPS